MVDCVEIHGRPGGGRLLSERHQHEAQGSRLHYAPPSSHNFMAPGIFFSGSFHTNLSIIKPDQSARWWWKLCSSRYRTSLPIPLIQPHSMATFGLSSGLYTSSTI